MRRVEWLCVWDHSLSLPHSQLFMVHSTLETKYLSIVNGKLTGRCRMHARITIIYKNEYLFMFGFIIYILR